MTPALAAYYARLFTEAMTHGGVRSIRLTAREDSVIVTKIVDVPHEGAMPVGVVIVTGWGRLFVPFEKIEAVVLNTARERT